MTRLWVPLAVLVAAGMAARPTEASHCGSVKHGCCPEAAKCEDQCSYTKYRKVWKTCYRLEERERKKKVWRTECKEVPKTCYKQVPKTCYKEVQCTEYKTEKRTCYKTCHETCYKEVTCTVCKPVKETCWKECKYTVCKPVTECHMKEECYTTCCPKKVYKVVTKEVCKKTKVREYLPAKTVDGKDCKTEHDECCDPCHKGLGLKGLLCRKKCGDDSCAKCEETASTIEMEGVCIWRPATIRKTISCTIPCTIMEKKECKRMVPCKVTRIEKQECVKKVPYCVTRIEKCEVTKKVPYTVCKKVPVEVCVKVPYTVCKKVPYTVCEKVPYCVIEKVPHKVCEVVCEKYTVKVPHRVCTLEPVCCDPCKPGLLGRLFDGLHKCDPCCEETAVDHQAAPAPAPKAEMKEAPADLPPAPALKTAPKSN